MNALTRRTIGLRKRLGTEVLFRTLTLKATTKTDISAIQRAFPNDNVGPFLAALDARLFYLNPNDFAPYNDVSPPAEGEQLNWHGLVYVIAKVSFNDVGADTNAIVLAAYRNVR